MEAVYSVRTVRVAFRLGNVQWSIELSMKECVFNVSLPDVIVSCCCDCEETTYRDDAGNWGIGVPIIKTCFLNEAFGDESGFVNRISFPPPTLS